MPGSITPLPVMLEDEQDREVYENLQPPSTIVVRYGYQRMVAELPYDGTAKPGCGSKIVIRTKRGTEIGEMLTSTCPNAGCSKSVTRKEMLDYIENSGGKDYPFTEQGQILRIASVEDMNQQAALDDEKPQIRKHIRQMIEQRGLKMRLVEVERLLGNERMILHYTADKWVDFRQLVKDLAAHYQTRIEMHQVNAREEARIVADYEKCGQHCCCKQFLKVLKPVSMRSAKVQKATLDPMKISGRCGRLMCCLRYEDETYEDLRKRLPARKSLVETEDGIGTVIDSQILTQLVLVKVGQAVPAAYPLENLRVLDKEEAKAHRREHAEPADKPAHEPGSEQDTRRAEQPGKPPRRPRPGQPLKDDQVESREGGYSNRVRKSRPDKGPRQDTQQADPDQSDPDKADPAKGKGHGQDIQGSDPTAEQQDDPPASDAGESAQGSDDASKKRRRRGRRRRRGGGGGGGGKGGKGGN